LDLTISNIKISTCLLKRSLAFSERKEMLSTRVVIFLKVSPHQLASESLLTSLITAILKYRQAAKILPTDPAPYGNLSAAYLETGQYKSCLLMAEKALKLRKESADFDKTSAQALKLQQRIEKANAHSGPSTAEEQRECRIKLMKILPRYRPKL
jgi:tetratricopeptide (TPR) repeat protein